jgi:hypothetical protein
MQMRFWFSAKSMAKSRRSLDTDEEVDMDLDTDMDIDLYDGPSNGEWTDIPCRKRNLVVCQKVQNWTVVRIQENLMKAIREMKAVSEESRQMKAVAASVLASLQTLIPVGFVYVEMSGQRQPKQLWPTFEWADVSADYGGLFFRVLGNDSAPFGTIQEPSAPRLVAVDRQDTSGCTSLCPVKADGEWSGSVSASEGYTGYNSYGSRGSYVSRSLRFKVSNDEVKPRNQAIRVWKRIA